MILSSHVFLGEDTARRCQKSRDFTMNCFVVLLSGIGIEVETMGDEQLTRHKEEIHGVRNEPLKWWIFHIYVTLLRV